MDIKNVLILGGGTMGQKISIQCAMYGFNVVIYDISDEILKKTKKITFYARILDRPAGYAIMQVAHLPDVEGVPERVR